MKVRPVELLKGLPFSLLLFILPFPGTVALRLLCLVAAFVLAIQLWRQGDTPSVPIRFALLAWAAVALLSLTYAVDPAYSLGEIKNELGYTMAAFFAFFVATKTRERLQAWALSVIAAATVISVWALVIWGGRGSWDDSAGHGGVGSFASLAVTTLPLIMLCWLFSWNGLARGVRIALAAVGVLILLAAVATQQRILWISFGVQFAVIVGLLWHSRILTLKPYAVALSLAGSLVLAGAAVLVIHNQKVDQSPVEYYDLGNDFRLRHWAQIMDRIGQSPLIGGGFGREAMKKAYPDLVPTVKPMTLLWHPHNVFLTYGVGMGIPGMLALLGVFGALVAGYTRHLGAQETDRRLVAIAGIALVSGLVVRNMTNDFFVRDGALMFWALNGALLGYLSRQSMQSMQSMQPKDGD